MQPSNHDMADDAAEWAVNNLDIVDPHRVTRIARGDDHQGHREPGEYEHKHKKRLGAINRLERWLLGVMR